MGYLVIWALGLAVPLADSGALSDRVLPGSVGNPWGPAATLARAGGKLPAVSIDPAMKKWDRWGRRQLRDGDVVFRLGDTRILWGYFPLSWFIARATGSRFSHVGLIAVEHDGPVVYQCVSLGVQRQPFHVWMQDNFGAFGVKRLKPEHRDHISGALDYCRRMFEAQPPFDQEFRLDDSKLYCVEFVEKAFRSQALPLSEPVRIGDWKNLAQFPLTTVAIVRGSKFLLDTSISLDQPVYVPGDDREGLWGSRRLETVALFGPTPDRDTSLAMPGGLGVRGDAAIIVYLALELRSLERTLRTVFELL